MNVKKVKSRKGRLEILFIRAKIAYKPKFDLISNFKVCKLKFNLQGHKLNCVH